MAKVIDSVVAAKLEFIQFGRETRRFHGLPMLDYQRVDAHQWGVVMLAMLLVGDDAPAERQLRLIKAASTHDLAEWIVGDVPAPSKRQMPDYPEGSFREVFGQMEDRHLVEAGFPLSELDARDKRVLKLADAAEGVLHCIRERQMGNAHPRLRACFYEFWKYCVEEQGLDSVVWRLDNNIPEEPGEVGLRHYLRSEWTRANGGAW